MKILIVEDEVMVAKRLMRMLKTVIDLKITKLHHCITLDDADDWLAEHSVDLLMLDLNLNGASGFDLLKKAVAESFQTIIVSANIDQAIDAFEYGVVDFVAKPFDLARLSKAISRIDCARNKDQTKLLAIKTSKGVELINLSEVNHIKAAGNYSELVLNDGTIKLHEKNLEKLIAILPENYIRIHKSFVVNVERVNKILSYSGSKHEVELYDSTLLPVGRTKIKLLREHLKIQ